MITIKKLFGLLIPYYKPWFIQTFDIRSFNRNLCCKKSNYRKKSTVSSCCGVFDWLPVCFL